jgi:hypothetical protein
LERFEVAGALVPALDDEHLIRALAESAHALAFVEAPRRDAARDLVQICVGHRGERGDVPERQPRSDVRVRTEKLVELVALEVIQIGVRRGHRHRGLPHIVAARQRALAERVAGGQRREKRATAERRRWR